MTADEAYRVIKYIANEYQGGNISPDDYTTITRYGQLSYMAFLLGQVEQQVQGRPISRVSLGNNDHVYQALSPFIIPYNISVNSSGIASRPKGFQAWVNMSTSDGKDIRFVQKDSWNNWKKSLIDPVVSNPIYTIDSGGFLFAPANIGNAVLTYIQSPDDSIWAFTEDSDGREVYDENNSVGLAWRDVDAYEVIARGLKLVSINLQSQAVAQVANSIITTGQ